MKITFPRLYGCAVALIVLVVNLGLASGVQQQTSKLSKSEANLFFLRCTEDDSIEDESCPGSNFFLMHREGSTPGDCKSRCVRRLFVGLYRIFRWSCGPCPGDVIRETKPVFIGGDTNLMVQHCDDTAVLLSGATDSEITTMKEDPNKYYQRMLWSDFSPSSNSVCGEGCKNHIYRSIVDISEPDTTGLFACPSSLNCAKITTELLVLEDIMDASMMNSTGLLDSSAEYVESAFDQVCSEAQGSSLPGSCNAWLSVHETGKCNYTDCFVGTTGDPEVCYFPENDASCGPMPDSPENAAINNFIPENIGDIYNFTDSCCSHDRCYSSIYTKSQCDLDLLTRSLQSCVNDTSLEGFQGFPVTHFDGNLTCEVAAVLYFLEASYGQVKSQESVQANQTTHELSPVCRDKKPVFVGGDTNLTVQHCNDSVVLLSSTVTSEINEIKENSFMYLQRMLWSDFSSSSSNVCAGGCKDHLYRWIDAIEDPDASGPFACPAPLTCLKITTQLVTVDDVMEDSMLESVGLVNSSQEFLELAFDQACDQYETTVLPNGCDAWLSVQVNGKCKYTDCFIGTANEPEECYFPGSDNSCGPLRDTPESAAINDFIPENLTGIYDFTDACCSHDRCYSSVYNKSQCDLDFLTDSLHSCVNDQSLEAFEGFPVADFDSNLTCEIAAVIYFLEATYGQVESHSIAESKQSTHELTPKCWDKRPVFVSGDTELKVEHCDDSAVLLSGNDASKIIHMKENPEMYKDRKLWSDFSPSNSNVCNGGCKDHIYRRIDAIEDPEASGLFSCPESLSCAKITTQLVTVNDVMEDSMLNSMGLASSSAEFVEAAFEQACVGHNASLRPDGCDAWFSVHGNGKCTHTNCFVGLAGDPAICYFPGTENSCGPMPDTTENTAINDFIPENLTGIYDFNDACCSHDRCYSSVFNKSQCDLDLLINSLLSCVDDKSLEDFEVFPVASFDGNLTCEIAAVLYFLEASYGQVESHDAVQVEQTKHDLSSMCSEVGDSGPRWSAYVFGDPHYVTFDGLAYSCQGRGEFVLVESLGEEPLDIHVFSVGDDSTGPTVARGVVIREEADAPTIQVSFASFAGTSDDCNEMELFADGTRIDMIADPGLPFFDDNLFSKTTYAYEGPGVTVEYIYPNKMLIEYESSGASVLVEASSHSVFGCYQNVHVSLPDSFVHFNEIVGLLGTPNDDVTDEWHSPLGVALSRTGSKDERLNEDAYDYCTENWCVGNPLNSLFSFDSSLENLFDCDAAYTPGPDINDPSDDLHLICGGNPFCLIDGHVGDFRDAAVTSSSQISIERERTDGARFRVCPNLVRLEGVKVDFLITVNVQGLVDDDDVLSLDGFVLYFVEGDGSELDPTTKTLKDDGTEPDAVSGDLIFSAKMAYSPVGSIPESLGFMAVPVINGEEDVTSPLVFTDMAAVWTSFGGKIHRVGSGYPHGVADPYAESSTDGGETWGPAYAVYHPWINDGEYLGPGFLHAERDITAGIGEVIWYRIRFTLPDPLVDSAVMVLKLKADNSADVLVNTEVVYTGVEGYSIELSPELLSPHLKGGDNELIFKVENLRGSYMGFQYWMEVTYNDYSCRG